MATIQPSLRTSQFTLVKDKTYRMAGDQARRLLAVDVGKGKGDFRLALTVAKTLPVASDWIHGEADNSDSKSAILFDTGCSSDLFIEVTGNKDVTVAIVSDVKAELVEYDSQ